MFFQHLKHIMKNELHTHILDMICPSTIAAVHVRIDGALSHWGE